MRNGIILWFFALAAGLAPWALAQNYPARPIKFVSPQPPGGAYDYLMRVFGERLQGPLGQPLVIEHHAGAALVVGLDYTAKQPPDGYTLLMSSTTHAIMPSLMPKLPFDPVRSFEPVSLVATAPLVLAVRADSPVKNVQDYIALARQKPGAITYGSSGVGTPLHFAGEMMKSMTGIDILHVPYKGAAAVVQGVLSGDLYSTFGPLTPLLPHMRSGKIRALATVGSRRSASVPDLPTIAESGLPGFAIDSWFGVFAPAGTPRPIIDRLNAEFNRVAQDPQFVKDKLIPAGLDGVGSTPEHLLEVLQGDIAKYAKIVKDAKIKPEQ